MREIKFRAWHEGFEGMAPHMLYDKKPGDCLVWLSHGQNISSVMQFTGLKDKNGKDIYEGDIVRFDVLGRNGREQPTKNQRGQVEYSGWHWSFGGWDAGWCCPIEVIGNIHETPEILKR